MGDEKHIHEWVPADLGFDSRHPYFFVRYICPDCNESLLRAVEAEEL